MQQQRVNPEDLHDGDIIIGRIHRINGRDEVIPCPRATVSAHTVNEPRHTAHTVGTTRTVTYTTTYDNGQPCQVDSLAGGIPLMVERAE